MKALYRFFKSVRLAIVLILVITVLSLLSTFIPQGQDPAFYHAKYPGWYGLITALHFDRFFSFSSFLFIVPVALFTLNLTVCAVDRFVRRARTKAAKHYGPDIVHLGLILLIVGGLVTAFARQEKAFYMLAGEEVPLTSTWSIKLVSFDFLKYENGMPKAWISTVQVLRDGLPQPSPFPIKVNHPLRLKGIAVYQTDWRYEAAFALPDGGEGTVLNGQHFQDGNSIWFFDSVREDGGVRKAVFQEYTLKGEQVSIRSVGPSDAIGPYRLREIRDLTGLTAVSDPGFLPVLFAVVIIAAGLALTFIQKKRVEQA